MVKKITFALAYAAILAIVAFKFAAYCKTLKTIQTKNLELARMKHLAASLDQTNKEALNTYLGSTFTSKVPSFVASAKKAEFIPTGVTVAKGAVAGSSTFALLSLLPVVGDIVLSAEKMEVDLSYPKRDHFLIVPGDTSNNTSGALIRLQPDGNVTIINNKDQMIWQSETGYKPGYAQGFNLQKADPENDKVLSFRKSGTGGPTVFIMTDQLLNRNEYIATDHGILMLNNNGIAIVFRDPKKVVIGRDAPAIPLNTDGKKVMPAHQIRFSSKGYLEFLDEAGTVVSTYGGSQENAIENNEYTPVFYFSDDTGVPVVLRVSNKIQPK